MSFFFSKVIVYATLFDNMTWESLFLTGNIKIIFMFKTRF